ncbi:hypothetical protein BG003_004051 [Podila horticola]|nr:hypothetical protein BG003_004051 [Podila horticola]
MATIRPRNKTAIYAQETYEQAIADLLATFEPANVYNCYHAAIMGKHSPLAPMNIHCLATVDHVQITIGGSHFFNPNLVTCPTNWDLPKLSCRWG